ncbi:hypothetical protein BCR37DRAFT_377714 [Protomyces lactucae-debilis]|uniref:Uncharacterized protein n=1 Tax=Protomyces lactucae-debilis TaxID=2754530 RepID=A0A1Y2FNU3_PROLT|nr:uncharacterized protein BCR37DRAFT_377714 [Protomyces lactucae-debilis]ORY84886.1 hypothetical protein BCR37DRAFT_377714 [Protomyces lactucae-debilis]
MINSNEEPMVCPFCLQNCREAWSAKAHIEGVCQRFCWLPEWLEFYGRCRPLLDSAEILEAREHVRAQHSVVDPDSGKDTFGMLQCQICMGFLRNGEHMRNHLRHKEYLHVKSMPWFLSLNLVNIKQPPSRYKSLMVSFIQRLLKRMQEAGEMPFPVDPELKKHPAYAYYYTRTSLQPSPDLRTPVFGIEDYPSTTQMALKKKRQKADSEDHARPTTSESPNLNRVAKVEPRHQEEDGNVVPSTQPSEDMQAECVVDSILSAHMPFVDLLLSTNIFFWYAWHLVQDIVQGVQSTAELCLLRPFDSIKEVVAENVDEVLRTGQFTSEQVADMQEKWNRDARFTAALSRLPRGGIYWIEESLRGTVQTVMDWVEAVQKTMLAIATIIVEHSAQQRWRDAVAHRTYQWAGDTQSLLSRTATVQRTILQCLTVHWIHWQDLCLDMEVHLKYNASRLQKRLQRLREEYDTEIAPHAVRPPTAADVGPDSD